MVSDSLRTRLTLDLEAFDGVRVTDVVLDELRRGGGGGIAGALTAGVASPGGASIGGFSTTVDGVGCVVVFDRRDGGGGGAALVVDSGGRVGSSDSFSSGTGACVRLEPLLVRVKALFEDC